MISSVNFEERLDVLLLTEMRQTNVDDVALRRCVPPVYTRIDVPRPSDNSRGTNYHGGVAAVVADQCFTCRVHAPLRTYTESFRFSVIGVGWSVVNLVIPNRPGSAPTAMPSSLNSSGSLQMPDRGRW